VSISVKEPPLVKVVIVGFCLFMFATFAALGEGQRYAVTGALFDFWQSVGAVDIRQDGLMGWPPELASKLPRSGEVAGARFG
jgi:hypothetical protein